MLEIKQFPGDMSALEVDREDPKRCLVFGLFEETVDVAGVNRPFYTYIAEGMSYNRPCLVLAPPEDISVPEYLENGFWLRFAGEHRFFLHVLEPVNGKYSLDGSDASYMNRVYVQIQSRRYYVTMQDNIYAVGVGRGAAVAQQAAIEMTGEWSGLATFGEMFPEVLESAGRLHAGEDTGRTELVVSAGRAQLPVWMAWSENTGENAAVCNYWKAENHADSEIFSNRWADEIYFPDRIQKKSQVNDETISQVRVTNGFRGEPGEEFFTAVWGYISQARRHRSFTRKALRIYEDPIAYGAQLHTMELDGFTRRWYEYVPEGIGAGDRKVPLVVCMHGRGGSAETFMDLSGLNRVAEERDFIAVFPEAGVYQQRPGGLRNILLWNGSYKGEKTDDVSFVLKIIEDVKSRYAIDSGRIYACGQSSGGMMTSELAVRAPEVFAAVSPWSAIKDPDYDGPPPENMDPVVPYLFLFGENDWLCVDREKGQMEYHVTPDIAAFLKNLMRIYRLNETPCRYVCGEISYYVYLNEKRVPLLIVGTVKEMSHANYPRESWIAYDEFLSKFSRCADGTLLYMGEEI